MQRRRQPNYSVNGESRPRKPGFTADARVKSIWNSAYARAKPFYVRTHAPDPEQQARNSAWRAVKFNTEYPIVGRTRNKKAVEIGAGPYVAIDPPASAWFGKLLEVTFFDVSGRLSVVHLTAQTDLLWDDTNKRVIAFPHMANGACMPVAVGGREVKGAVAMYKRWHKRSAERIQVTGPPQRSTWVIGTVDTLSYRSDKWTKSNPDPLLRGSPEYLHQVDDFVFVRTSRESKKGIPYVIIIEGGRLDATEAGIIH